MTYDPDPADPCADLARAVTRERYVANHWWATPATDHPERPGAAPTWDDSELACSRRRRAALADIERHETGECA